MNEELKKWLHDGNLDYIKERFIKFINMVVEETNPEKLQYTCSRSDNSSRWNYYNEKLKDAIYIGTFDNWTTYLKYENGILFQFLMNEDSEIYKQRIPIQIDKVLDIMERIDDTLI